VGLTTLKLKELTGTDIVEYSRTVRRLARRMMTAQQDSGLQVFRSASKSAAADARTDVAAKPTIWLNGEVLGCQCPDCKSPVSVRAWLMMGDCAHCGASFELTEEQEREAQRLLAERDRTVATAPAKSPVRQSPAMPRPAEVRSPTAKTVIPALPATAPARIRLPAQERHARSVSAPEASPVAATQNFVRVEKAIDWKDLLRDLPAWLISLVVHMALIMLLALWVPERDTPEEQIVLSAVMGHRHQEGERTKSDPQVDEVEIADPGGDAGDPEPPAEKAPPAKSEQEQAAAESDASELLFGEEAHPAAMPELARVLSALERPSHARMFDGRDPRVRATVINAEGGTTYTEAAVARGLRWLSKHQCADGSWSLHKFHQCGDCNGRCNGQGQEADTAATAMAILPMLGAGQTHLQGRYARQVAGGLKYLLSHQRPNGDLRGNGVGRMYAHGQAAIVLCEAFALTGDEQLRQAAQKAIDFIIKAQHYQGGWRYEPGEPGDTSVVGWQLMALQSARMAQIDVPAEVLEKANEYLNRAQCDPIGGAYSYQPGGQPTATMTAEALLCRQYLGWPKKQPGLRAGSRFLVRNWLPSKEQPNIYYWYYATQVMHHLGGQRWKAWNHAMRDTLVEMQETEGHMAGSWSPVGGAIGNHDTQTGGRLYMTSLAICTLEVYYRHLPIYRAIESRAHHDE
jgi:hypothetical protein